MKGEKNCIGKMPRVGSNIDATKEHGRSLEREGAERETHTESESERE